MTGFLFGRRCDSLWNGTERNGIGQRKGRAPTPTKESAHASAISKGRIGIGSPAHISNSKYCNGVTCRGGVI